MLHELEYERKSHRYKWATPPAKGQYVSNATVRSLVSQNIEQQQEKARQLTQQLFNDEIKLSEWELEFAQIIKDSTLQHYAIGKPGKLTFADYGRSGGYLGFQYGKLRGFTRQIQSGRLSKAQILARQDLYLNKTREAYEEGRRKAHQDTGWIWEARVKPAKESCNECIYYYSLGYQLIGSLPRPTQKCTCMANCKCYLIFSKSTTRPTRQSISSHEKVSIWQSKRLAAKKNQSISSCWQRTV